MLALSRAIAATFAVIALFALLVCGWLIVDGAKVRNDIKLSGQLVIIFLSIWCVLNIVDMVFNFLLTV